jgi:hypothetical protein
MKEIYRLKIHVAHRISLDINQGPSDIKSVGYEPNFLEKFNSIGTGECCLELMSVSIRQEFIREEVT